MFQNKQQHASALLGSILGFGEDLHPEPKKHEINTAALLHIYTASALHSWLENGSSEALVKTKKQVRTARGRWISPTVLGPH